MQGYKALVYSPDCQVVIAAKNGDIDISSDVIGGEIQRSGEGVSFFSLRLANKGLKYNNAFRRMDRVVIRMKRIKWVTVFSGYLNRVPSVQLYPGQVTITGSCTLKRLKYTYWDPGLTASAMLFDQFGTDAANGGAGTNTDAGMGFMLKNILKEVGGWTDEQLVVQPFPTAFVDYLAKGAEKYKDSRSEALKKFKEIFDYDEATGVSGGAANGGSTMGPVTATQEEHVRSIHAASLERGMGVEGTIRATMTGLVESQLRILANPAVPDSYNYPHEGEGTDHDSIGIFQQRQAGWGTVAERMNAQASAGMFLNGMLKLGDWKSRARGESCQAVQVSAVPDAYAAREADAVAIVTKLGLTDTGGNTTSGSFAGASTSGSAPTTGAPKAPTSTNPPTTTTPGAPAAAGAGAVVDANNLPPMPSRMGSEEHWLPDTIKVARVVAMKWPELESIGGWRPYDAYPDHPGGFAADIMIPNYAANVGLGTAINDFLKANAGALGIKYTIWRQTYWDPSSSNVMEDRGSDTQNHFDHVHVTTHGNSATGGPLDGTTSGGSPGAGAGTSGSSFQNKLAKNLFGYLFDPTKYINESSNLWTGEKASINDEPLINTVNAICRARMCKYMSAPTGEFLAYYPDYFGLDGTPAKLDLEDIELKNLTIDLNDDNIVTHMFVAGTNEWGKTQEASDAGWLGTSGVATVTDEWLFDRVLNASVAAPDVADAAEYLNRFGIRPLKEEYADIRGTTNSGVELMIATQRFMQKWAEQSMTNVEMTFMPELFPGMRVNLVGHDITVYVSAVSHSFDYTNGFRTTASIMAPSKTSAFGVPVTEGDG